MSINQLVIPYLRQGKDGDIRKRYHLKGINIRKRCHQSFGGSGFNPSNNNC